MKDLKIVNGDLVIGQDIATVSDSYQVAQSASIILKTSLGDFSLEPDFGLDMSNILARQIVPDYVQRDVETALLEGSEQISDVDDFEISQDKETRSLSISFRLQTATGDSITTEVDLSAG